MKPHFAPAPSSTMEYHRDALDQALRQALGTSQPALRQQALDRASTHLIHPGLLLESPLLTDSHPWRREALAVSDAFEAVTNGMEEPGVLEALETLEPGSPFEPWRHLILAIHFFYEGLDEGVASHLARIPATGPLQPLVKVLSGLIEGPRQTALHPVLRRLAEWVAQPDPLVLQWVQDISEGLEADQEGLFWGALADWLEAVAPEAPERARSAVLWAWTQLEWRDFDEEVLLDLAASLWGKAESYRLAALGTLGWDAEGAALLWLRFLVTAIRDGDWDRTTLEAGRRLADRFEKAWQESGDPTIDGEETWKGLTLGWNAEVALRGWTHLGFGPAAPTQPSGSPAPAPDGQLDLFS